MKEIQVFSKIFIIFFLGNDADYCPCPTRSQMLAAATAPTTTTTTTVKTTIPPAAAPLPPQIGYRRRFLQ